MIKLHFYTLYPPRCVGNYFTLCFCFILLFSPAFSQNDTQSLKNLYDRVLDFDESKMDSIEFYANQIQRNADELGFNKGELLSARLKGIHAEYTGDYQQAINYYLRCLEISKEKKLEAYEASALSDLAYLYSSIKNPVKAKEFYIETARMAIARGEVSAIVTDLTNLGAIYNQLGQPDSALFFLEMALKSASGYEGRVDLTSGWNNMGNAWFQKKEWLRALNFFRLNFVENTAKDDKNMLWYDVLNMADVFIEINKFDSAKIYLEYSLKLAKQLVSQRKEADVHQLFAKYYSRRNDFRGAYESLQRWNSIDTSLVNAETRATLLNLEERFHSKQRANENKLLVTEIEAERLRSRNISFLAFGIGGIAIVTGFFLYLIRKKNRKLEEKNILIQEQNDKLADLNSEKNSLISVVSHDLNTPFSSIKMWTQLLDTERNEMKDSQIKAVDRIKSSVDNGLNLIRNILDVERVQTNSQVIHLEKLDVQALVYDIIQDNEPISENKDIKIHFEPVKSKLLLMSDKEMLSRVFSNLLSNAIKFTPRGKNIYITVTDKRESVEVIFKDEGLGIDPGEMKYLFAKYSKISTASTEGEASTGLGLSIVKRILTELNGNIRCTSERGSGSVFTVELKR